jgi:hypothetical protein
MPLLALDDEAMRAVLAAAETIPIEKRSMFLQRVATELAAQPTVGAGNAHRIAYAVARSIGMEAQPARPRWTRMPNGSSRLFSGK